MKQTLNKALVKGVAAFGGIALALLSSTACSGKAGYNDVIVKTGVLVNTFSGTSSTDASSCRDLGAIVHSSDLSLSANERRQAVIDNLAFISYTDANGNAITIASAIRLSEGGYFATAAHAAKPIRTGRVNERPYKNAALVHVASGQAYEIHGVLIDEAADVAYIYAPNGNLQQPIRGIEFSSDAPLPGAALEMLALNIEPEPREVHYQIVSQRGKATTPNDVIPEYRQPVNIQIPVRGMIPAGGFSGAPVINNLGRIEGIESGLFSDTALPVNQLERKDYNGSYIGPVTALANLAADACAGRQ